MKKFFFQESQNEIGLASLTKKYLIIRKVREWLSRKIRLGKGVKK